MASKGIKSADQLIDALAASKKEQAELWHRFVVLGAYEQAHGRKPTQRDVDIEIRRRMKNEDPEIIRWRLAKLIGPLRHGVEE